MTERERGPKLGRLSPAARGVLEKLERLPSTRSAPVDTDGLAKIMRSADGQLLNGQILFQVLLSLKASGSWQLALALVSMVEASTPEVRAPRGLTSQAQQFLDTGFAPNIDIGVEDAEEQTEEEQEDEDEEALSDETAAAAREVAEEAWFSVEEDEFDDGEDDDDAEFRRRIQQSPNFAGSPGGDDEPHPMAALLGNDGGGGGGGSAPMDMMLPVDTMHYNVLIATCAGARRWRETLTLLSRMRENGVPRDTVTYNTVLHALDKGGRSHLAMKMFTQMRRERVPPNTVTFATAIAACAHARQFDAAMRAFDLCFDTNTPRNTIVYSSAITACDKAGEWQRALDLLARMRDDEVPADVAVLNAAASACARAGQPDAARQILSTAFQEHGLEPDRYTYNAVLSALSRALPEPRTAELVALLDEMKQLGDDKLRPDTYSYNALIHAHSRSGDAAAAVAVLREAIPADGLKPDTVSFTSSVAACAHSADWPTARSILIEAEEAPLSEGRGRGLNTLIYSKAIAVAAKAGEWAECLKLLEAISDVGLSHNPLTTNLALSAAKASSAGPDAPKMALEALRGVLDDWSRHTAQALGPNPSAGTRGPPVDRETVTLTRELLALAPSVGSGKDADALILDCERATLKPKRARNANKRDGSRATRAKSRPRGRGGGGGGRGRGGSRGRGRGPREPKPLPFDTWR